MNNPHPKFKKISLFLGVILLLVGMERAFAAQDPIEMLSSVTGSVMEELKKYRPSVQQQPNKLYSMVDRLIVPYVDFVEMARWVVGRNAWNKADETTQKEFVKEFRRLVVRSYARTLLEYKDQVVKFLPLRSPIESQQRIQISSYIIDNVGTRVHIEYRLLLEEDKWRVYDIIVEGVSLVQGYRAQFAEDIRDGGVAEIVAKMRQHNI